VECDDTLRKKKKHFTTVRATITVHILHRFGVIQTDRITISTSPDKKENVSPAALNRRVQSMRTVSRD
jgi:hypothetical protein